MILLFTDDFCNVSSITQVSAAHRVISSNSPNSEIMSHFSNKTLYKRHSYLVSGSVQHALKSFSVSYRPVHGTALQSELLLQLKCSGVKD